MSRSFISKTYRFCYCHAVLAGGLHYQIVFYLIRFVQYSIHMTVLVPVVVVVVVAAVQRFADCNFVQLVFDLGFDCSMGRIDTLELDSQMVVLVLDNL